MKIIAAADIHSSRYYCTLLVEAFAREGADQLLLLGDILTYSSGRGDVEQEAMAVAELLNSLSPQIICVRGNCDWPGNQEYLNFPCLNEYALLNLGRHSIFATHGHCFHEQHLPPLDFDIFLQGHTHVPEWRKNSNYLYLNPGSVSRPRGGSPHSYLLLEEDLFVWKNLATKEPFRSYIPG